MSYLINQLTQNKAKPLTRLSSAFALCSSSLTLPVAFAADFLNVLPPYTGPEGVYVQTVYVNGSTVYAPLDTGRLAISTDGGYTYTNKTNANSGLGMGTITDLQIVGTTIYAATQSGVSISTDGGTTFTTYNEGMADTQLNCVYADGSGKIYAGTWGGLAISTNGGANFINKTTADGLGHNVILGVAASGSTIYAATYGGGVSISHDGGTTFTSRTVANSGLGNDVVNEVYLDGTTLYAATNSGGLSISTDGGNTFVTRTTANGLPSDWINGVYAAGSKVCAAATWGLGLSTDGGATFTYKNTLDGIGDNIVRDCYFSGLTIYAATNGGVSFTPPPTAPTGLTATAVSPTQINLAWTDTSSNEAGFKIEQPAGTLINTTAVNATSYSHTGLTCGTTYNYTVKATNPYGDSSSVTTSATTQACTLTLATTGNGIGMVSSSGTPAGSSCGADCLSYLSSTAVTLTATTSGGSTFVGWNCTPAFTSGNTLTAATTCTAIFTYDPIYNLTLATTGNGTGTINSSGTPAGVSCGANCLTYVSTTTVTLTATGTNGSTFAGWSCTPAFTSGNTLTVNTTCTASFEAPAPIPHYHLSVQTDGTGTGTVTGSGSYPAGTTVTLEAVPDKESTFVGWSSGCSNEMTLTADITCTATFMGLPPPRTLYLTFAGTGQGQLSGGLASDSTGINCSSATPTCSYTVFGTQWVYPKFTPVTGSELAGWSGDPACTQDGSSKILLLQDTHCTVTVNLKLYTLSVGRNVPGVTLTSDGLNCQDTPEGFRNLAGAADLTACQATYPYGTTVKITASPAPLEWEWVGWKGSCDNQGQVVITQDRLCQAQYREDPNVPNGIDGNGDGENDARQPHVMSLADKVAGSYITLVVNPECVVADSSTLLAESLDGHDPNHPAPQGLMYFELRCSQTPVTMYFHGVNRIPRNVELLKYGPTTPGDENTVGWYKLPDVKFSLATVGGKPVATVTYTLTDGQLGDNTGVDGKIVDPAGLGLK